MIEFRNDGNFWGWLVETRVRRDFRRRENKNGFWTVTKVKGSLL